MKLIKYTGAWDGYASRKTAGALIFAQVTGDTSTGMYIYANGHEYNVADAASFKAFETEVRRDWKVKDIDAELGKVATIDESGVLTLSHAVATGSAQSVEDNATLASVGYVKESVKDLAGAMHYRGTVSSDGTTIVEAIKAWYAANSIETAKAGDVFVDTKTGKEWVVKAEIAAASITETSIEEFGNVDPST